MHAFMQYTNRDITIPINTICNANSKHFRLCSHMFWLAYSHIFWPTYLLVI